MNIYILCTTANTQSKEYICSAHPECGMDVAQRPYLWHYINMRNNLFFNLTGNEKQGSKQNSTDKRGSVRKSLADPPTPAPRIIPVEKVWMYFLYIIA